jgi:hypothetical protein
MTGVGSLSPNPQPVTETESNLSLKLIWFGLRALSAPLPATAKLPPPWQILRYHTIIFGEFLVSFVFLEESQSHLSY